MHEQSSASPLDEEKKIVVNKEERMNEVIIDVDGVSFASLFFIPSTISFIFVIQFCEHIKDTTESFNQACIAVSKWTEQFYQLFKEVFFTKNNESFIVLYQYIFGYFFS